MTSGTAEIFGSELAIDTVYTFSGRKLAIYTWEGCTIEIGNQAILTLGRRRASGQLCGWRNAHGLLFEYTSCPTTRKTEDRTQCNQSFIDFKVMIVGPPDVGKTSLCKILINYAVKQGGKPLFVDIDTNEVTNSING
jgi:polyribonucleotide 5'-hydroxyl-kinase